ncbi:hypothetical protein CIP101434_01851 [Corynebacterium diphtheriae]|nr:hypothetical protein CIP101280_01561 [Corynebacterium diphtheriae]CAB0521498.1 hypothetical protein CIP101434_01851 [Corynebacterium diphtheriae]
MSFLNQGGYNLMRHLIRGKHAQSHSKPAVLFALLATLTLAGCEGEFAFELGSKDLNLVES